MWLRFFLSGVLVVLVVQAQEGDNADEIQALVVPKALVPPAPVLSPSDALQSFKLQPGFRIELIASEPLVHDPVQIAFDPDGRLWVLEMRGFMQNLEGVGELEKVGSVAVLEDTDGDGKMDERTVFLDELVTPRAMALARGGVLVAEPPNLWFCQDTDGDRKCDKKTLIATDYATEADPKFGLKANVEHSANGLLWALDNWIYSANYTTRFRNTDGAWRREPAEFRGQWGISQDDFGRLVYNSNSDQLRIDLVPSAYLGRNPNYHGAAGLNVQPLKDQSVWPIRVNPGVNRGYQKGQLRSDGTLATFTAACAPVVYRGDNFPDEFRGNVFVCEPAANLVRRNVLAEDNLNITARNPYDKTEFLASTDERFRPVNLANGPDGCLYIVDFHRGIIQHRLYVTTYLRNQILDRGLEKPTGLGRIYRVVYDPKRPEPKPALSKARSEELVKSLSHPNGWWRDTAQRLLVERNDSGVVPSLKQLAASGSVPFGRLHALWVLEGTRQHDSGTLKAALSDAHPKLRAAAIRMSEPLLGSQPELFSELLKRVDDPEPEVLLQLAFTLGQIKDRRAEEALAKVALKTADNLYLRDAVLTGLGGRELDFLESLLSDRNWCSRKSGYDRFLGALAKCVFTEANSDRVSRLLELTAKRPADMSWQQTALLDGILSTVPPTQKGKPTSKPVRLNIEPPALAALGKTGSTEIRERAVRVTELVIWPGKPGVEPEKPVKPLTSEQQKQFDQGKELYLISCAACHQAHGLGQEGLAPPLVDSDWSVGPPERLVRIVLHGIRGPIQVKGRTYELDMPSLGVFEDDQVAAVLTYIRREWGHTADPVEPELVKKIRAETEKREEAWTETELLKIP
jgi:mono/diheme cytochrome c family protein/glucose/arabinose dehydrogenase